MNVLYIIAHDQGIVASCYHGAGPGAEIAHSTPKIDRIAQSGAILTSHFATAPMCSPARGSLLTSKLPHENGLVGLVNRNFVMHPNQTTILHHFAAHGYHTFLVGLQHETKNPFLMGYQTIVADESFRRCAELTPKIDILFQSFSEDSTPWWVTIGTKEIHRSWGIRGTLVDPSTVHVPAYLPDTPQARKDLAGFLGDLHAYDTFIGSVYDLLTKYHLLESTIVIVTTDHGIALPHAKGTLYDPGIQTLMIWSSPKIIPAGQRISTLVSSLDFAPTICELCDIDSHPEFTGKSYAAALRGETLEDTAIHDYIFAEKDFADIYDPIRAIRSPQFKYIRNYTTIPVFDMPPRDIRWGSSYKSWKKQLKNSTRAKEEFYDLTADPLEQQNLILTHPAIPEIQHMRSILDDHLEQINDLIRFGTYPAQFHASIDNARKFPHLKDYY